MHTIGKMNVNKQHYQCRIAIIIASLTSFSLLPALLIWFSQFVKDDSKTDLPIYIVEEHHEGEHVYRIQILARHLLIEY